MKNTYRNEVELVRDSINGLVESRFEEVFFENLFSMQPTLRLLLPDDHWQHQGTLCRLLNSCIELLDGEDDHVNAIEEIGRDYVLYGGRESNYKLIRSALLCSLKVTLGEELDRETELAWAKLYDKVTDIMRRGSLELLNTVGSRQMQNNDDEGTIAQFRYSWAKS